MKKKLLLVGMIFFSIMVQAHEFALDDNFAEKEKPITLKKNSFCNINIPDTNFEQALIDLGYNTYGLNGNILITDAEAVTSLSLPNAINDLTGIEGFTQLIDLHISVSNSTSLDGSQNTNLDTVNCRSNTLTSLELSQKTI
ncbi:hypothetical protein K8354_16545 [Polaribacter litorisediminis]|uniref:hypothetical protein n=1 Tax=Polaribacter litorisediminis TaxID=1908341 RepID=UPI001CBB87F6|nr:hypothetical protein [Polaribacter litorisediminis]UAM97876.1 hypothetical protein K8354_16545 [Polaribacter litorisediminis]